MLIMEIFLAWVCSISCVFATIEAGEETGGERNGKILVASLWLMGAMTWAMIASHHTPTVAAPAVHASKP